MFEADGTRSSRVYPLPALTLAGFAVTIAPNSKSPLVVVLALALFGAALVPCAATATSSEFAVATPAYSRIANRSVASMVSATVIVFAPPLMFSAKKMPKVSPAGVSTVTSSRIAWR